MASRRIDTVVRVRALQERLARAAVARSQATAADAARREAGAWQALAERDHALRGTFDQATFGARERALVGGHVAAVGAQRRHGDARLAVADSIGRWTIAARDHDGVERLAGRLAADAQAEAVRLAGAELDELVVLRHGRTA